MSTDFWYYAILITATLVFVVGMTWGIWKDFQEKE